MCQKYYAMYLCGTEVHAMDKFPYRKALLLCNCSETDLKFK